MVTVVRVKEDDSLRGVSSQLRLFADGRETTQAGGSISAPQLLNYVSPASLSNLGRRIGQTIVDHDHTTYFWKVGQHHADCRLTAESRARQDRNMAPETRASETAPPGSLRAPAREIRCSKASAPCGTSKTPYT